MAKIFRLHCVESERGWGRSYDYTDYPTRPEAEAAMKRINDQNTSDSAPDWYYQAESIEEITIPDEIVKSIAETVKEIPDMSNPILSVITDSQYRDSVDPAMTELGETLADMGVVTSDGNETDAELIEIATRKLKMLHEIVKSTLTPGILAAIMKN